MMYDYRDTVRFDARKRRKKDFLPRPKKQKRKGGGYREWRGGNNDKKGSEEAQRHGKEIYCACLPRCSTLSPRLATEGNDTAGFIKYFSSLRGTCH